MSDKLAHVKALFHALTLDGFGARRYVGHHRLDRARTFLHTVVAPALWRAITADDPGYNPLGPPTDAHGTAAVRYFVTFLEAHREFERLAHPHDELWHLLYQPGQEGCFFDDLCAALHADDPDWAGPAPFDAYPPAIHPHP
ncbi:hypothetical protein IU500_06885 [Nocardia terpenica]|uniref:hypothetical protein n=1 Tax=Nocardia terpenica TaxID=455432 RepID=UPI001894A1E2|nr:hypothetical protein [Nocardia terpenica]MBF6060501.1 hypothetical protein [Nocardia terpenica]MBF6103761.1 hypothetical protein [Nocardia terpenica]MBF6111865.1 hypothetical protein [Nocardia terpenica]MBF6117982.1 hypothetical protein [Nocardia terpenica]MBF6155292.1 hypothetical protein [Nocardia terpenica]